jgi:hypothetical protein
MYCSPYPLVWERKMEDKVTRKKRVKYFTGPSQKSDFQSTLLVKTILKKRARTKTSKIQIKTLVSNKPTRSKVGFAKALERERNILSYLCCIGIDRTSNEKKKETNPDPLTKDRGFFIARKAFIKTLGQR